MAWHVVRWHVVRWSCRFPQGSTEEGDSQCLLLADIPAMHPSADADCEAEVDAAGHLLGGWHKLAVYTTTTVGGGGAPVADTTASPATAPPAESGVVLIGDSFFQYVPAPTSGGIGFDDALRASVDRTYNGDFRGQFTHKHRVPCCVGRHRWITHRWCMRARRVVAEVCMHACARVAAEAALRQTLTNCRECQMISNWPTAGSVN
jgi:hypothetical protein